ncbi:MAG: response regulator transcription factor [Ignavibacteriaceae bacterium]|jgi:DNA-binding NarL/FixJ family response regulator
MSLRKTVRILLSDDHSLLRTGVISMLKDEKNFLIVGEAENGEQLIDKYFKLIPDIIISDISMPKMSGIDAFAKIKKKEPLAKALFLSMYEGEEYIYSIYKAGGSGLINKNIVKGELLFAIKKVLEGNYYFGAKIQARELDEIVTKYSTKKLFNLKKTNLILTDREMQVLSLIGEAKTSNDIAVQLDLSKRTVDTHRTNIMQKLNLKSLPELIRFAVNYVIELRKTGR